MQETMHQPVVQVNLNIAFLRRSFYFARKFDLQMGVCQWRKRNFAHKHRVVSGSRAISRLLEGGLEV